MVNYLSIDFESWAHPDRPEFNNLSSARRKKIDAGFVQKSGEAILKILRKHNTKLTFFIVGQFYEWYPALIDQIEKEGHEIGYHMHEHELIRSVDVLKRSLEKSKDFIQRFQPKGFRAPRVSVDVSYLKVLKKYGFLYDSSFYGTYAKRRTVDGIYQIPVTKIGPIPIGSGYFLGAFGKNIDYFYQYVNKKKEPMVSFVHNWQIFSPIKPSFPDTSHLITHPHYFPYLINTRGSVEYLLKKKDFKPMIHMVSSRI